MVAVRNKPQIRVTKGSARSLKPIARKDPSLDIKTIERAAIKRKARDRLSRLEEIRDAGRLLAAGRSQREIAEALQTTQPRVHRMLKVIETSPPDAETPEEIILRGTLDDVDRGELVKRLSKCKYTFAEHAPAPFEGSAPGTWNQIVAARVSGLLSKEEFERVVAAVKPPRP